MRGEGISPKPGNEFAHGFLRPQVSLFFEHVFRLDAWNKMGFIIQASEIFSMFVIQHKFRSVNTPIENVLKLLRVMKRVFKWNYLTSSCRTLDAFSLAVVTWSHVTSVQIFVVMERKNSSVLLMWESQRAFLTDLISVIKYSIMSINSTALARPICHTAYVSAD